MSKYVSKYIAADLMKHGYPQQLSGKVYINGDDKVVDADSSYKAGFRAAKKVKENEEKQ